MSNPGPDLVRFNQKLDIVSAAAILAITSPAVIRKENSAVGSNAKMVVKTKLCSEEG